MQGDFEKDLGEIIAVQHGVVAKDLDFQFDKAEPHLHPAEGAIFILDQSLRVSKGFVKIAESFRIRPAQIVGLDEDGESQDDEEEAAMGTLEHFLEVYRKSDEYSTRHKEIGGTIEDTRQARETLRDIANNKQAQQAIVRMGNLVKIVVPQLQLSFISLNLNFQWPPTLVALARQLGSVINLDLPTLLPLGCLSGGGPTGRLDTALAYSGGIIALMVFFICLCGVQSGIQSTWTQKGDKKAAGKAAHIANFFWALYTLVAPVVFSKVVWLASAGSNDDEIAGIMTIPVSITLLVLPILAPGIALTNMFIARREGRLHSRAFEARYGWLCARCDASTSHEIFGCNVNLRCRRYKANCFWWDILYIEARFMTTAAGTLLSNQVHVALTIIGIAAFLLFMQKAYQPFAETDEEKSQWNSANNVAILSYACQVIVLLCGLTSLWRDPGLTSETDAGYLAGYASGYDVGLLDGILCLVAMCALATPLLAGIYTVLQLLEPKLHEYLPNRLKRWRTRSEAQKFTNPLSAGDDMDDETIDGSSGSSESGNQSVMGIDEAVNYIAAEMARVGDVREIIRRVPMHPDVVALTSSNEE